MTVQNNGKKNTQDKRISELDWQILRLLQKNSRSTLEELSSKLDTSKSTIHYRIKRLEEEGVLEGYYSKINPSKLGLDFTAILLIRAKFGPRYHEKVGEALAQIPGVSVIYFLFGETDFLVVVRSRDRADFFEKIEKLYNMEEIERTNTVIVAKIIRDDPRLQI